MMEDEVDAVAGGATGIQIADVTLDEVERAAPIDCRSGRLLQIPSRARREVVQSNHRLTQSQELLDEIGPDETRRAGDQPSPGRPLQLPLEIRIRSGFAIREACVNSAHVHLQGWRSARQRHPGNARPSL